MLTRSWDDCVKFAVILSETEGVDDLGRKLLDDAGVRKEEIVGSQETLRKLRAENEMLAEEAKAAARKAKEERLLRLAYQIGRGGEEEKSARKQCKWKPIKSLPNARTYLNYVATTHNKVYVADSKTSHLYVRKFRPSNSSWSPVFNSSVRDIKSFFSAGEECFGTFLKKGRNQSIEKYIVEKNNWEHVMKLPSLNDLSNYGIVADGDHICIAGGRYKAETTDEILIYDIKTGKKCVSKKMTTKRQGCSCAIKDNILFVGGGWNTGYKNELNSVECISLTEYHSHPKVPDTPTKSCSLTFLCNKLVMSGGRQVDSLSASKMVSVLSPSYTWLPLVTMKQARRHHGTCITPDDGLMVMGGLCGRGSCLNTVEVLTW
jgi:hypothetical protein